MLSMFFKKKQNPETPTEDIIQGPLDPAQQQNNGDDFIFVERKTTPDDPTKSTPTPTHAIYPPMPPVNFGLSGLPYPMPTIGQQISNTTGPVSYVQDIPFELSPQLNTKNVFEVTQLQVDGILAFITRQLSVDEQNDDYNFALERSIQNESY